MVKLKDPIAVCFYNLCEFGKCSLKAVPTKTPEKARIVVFQDTGFIMGTRNATPNMQTSEMYTKIDKRTNAKFCVMNIKGKMYYISHARIYEFAYGENEMPEMAKIQIERHAQYKKNKSEGIKPKWRE